MDTNGFKEFRKNLLKCNDCSSEEVEPKPIVWGEIDAKIVHISQAPSQSIYKCGRPFSKNLSEPNASGMKLIEWYGLHQEVFYDQKVFYITGMSHCYPGKKHGGDTDPPSARGRVT